MNKSANDFKDISVDEVLKNINEDTGNPFIEVFDDVKFNGHKYIAVKDNMSQIGAPTTNGSKMLANYQSPFDATIIKLLKEKGYTIVGKANLDEYAMGSTNLTSFAGPVDNAFNSDYISGGSSGGSAYAVAKGLVPFALGTDTGGSIRQPAAFNGIYGMKPTYGLISRYGVLPFASSFDVTGPMTNTVIDNATLLNDLAVNDEYDQTNFVPVDYDATSLIGKSLKGMKIGVLKEWEDAEYHQDIKDAIKNNIQKLEQLGAEIKEFSIPITSFSFELYMILAYAEGSSNLNRYDGIRFGNPNDGTVGKNASYKKVRDAFGTEVKKRLIIGSYMISSAHSDELFEHAQKVRQKMCNEFTKVYSQVDAIVGPTTPNLAFDKNYKQGSYEVYLSDKFLIPANLVGFPALNIPAGFSQEENLPIGMSVMSDLYREDIIYQIASALENKGGPNV
jgi:aspartyl-tRNA(Asn)/glutamyl-tRNA(Gln) amidotransferase subunit A